MATRQHKPPQGPPSHGTAGPECPKAVLELLERFERNREAYHSDAYNEAQVRREFIDPFFKALGWDVDNERGYAEPYKDVIYEDAIKVGGASKAPDYCFRIGGARKFFVEAKRPSANLAEDASLAYQLRRYAWSAKLPLSILTDFEELAVYDCRIKPGLRDAASKGRVLFFRCEEYPTRWAELAAVFARDAVLKGSFDRYAESTGRKRGTAEVDDAFLAEIENWRDLLARNIALRNPDLSQRELNFAVGRTIDRIIFLRMCEDRAIEDYGRLQALLNGENVYARVCELFRRADDRYNSGLFHFRREKGRAEPPDELTPGLDIDDKALKDIVRGLYYPDSPYEFSVLPADILGQVYEQFLGKVIRLTAGHRAVVEDKPEVKKAGGVYYTPTYIVDYIVEHTVGKLLEGKAPRDVAGIGRGKRPLRVLDPACGSGSFLIGAYQRLLDWHRDWYAGNLVPLLKAGKSLSSREVRGLLPQRSGEKAVQPVYEASAGEWRLTTGERKRILLVCIYGVDIDPQAVEVTKLSLLLKVLEGETGESLARQSRIWHERALPDLAANIKCGNSLIGPDFYRDRQGKLFDDEERYRINAFDWQHEFPEVLGVKEPGFDAVIGNPPYVRPHKLSGQEKQYFWRHYKAFVKKSDLYCCFIERGLELLQATGLFGFIVSKGWLRLDSFEKLRNLLLQCTCISQIVEFDGNVFAKASVGTAILVFSKGYVAGHQTEVAIVRAGSSLGAITYRPMAQDAFRTFYKSIFDVSADADNVVVKTKMLAAGPRLGECFDMSFGLKTGDDARFIHTVPSTPEHRPLLRGENVHRYCCKFAGEYVWYVPSEMKAHRRTARPGSGERFEQPKVLVRDTGHGLQATYDGERWYVKDVLIVSRGTPDVEPLKAVAGLLNSRAMRFFYETSFPTLHVQRSELASLPVPASLVSGQGNAGRAQLASMVEAMLDLHKQLQAAKLEHEKVVLGRQVDATDREIDKLVYELYGLTEEEIAIVEAATKT